MPSLLNSEVPLGYHWTPGPLVECAGYPHPHMLGERRLLARATPPVGAVGMKIPPPRVFRVFSGTITGRATRAIPPLHHPAILTREVGEAVRVGEEEVPEAEEEVLLLRTLVAAMVIKGPRAHLVVPVLAEVQEIREMIRTEAGRVKTSMKRPLGGPGRPRQRLPPLPLRSQWLRIRIASRTRCKFHHVHLFLSW